MTKSTLVRYLLPLEQIFEAEQSNLCVERLKEARIYCRALIASADMISATQAFPSREVLLRLLCDAALEQGSAALRVVSAVVLSQRQGLGQGEEAAAVQSFVGGPTYQSDIFIFCYIGLLLAGEFISVVGSCGAGEVRAECLRFCLETHNAVARMFPNKSMEDTVNCLEVALHPWIASALEVILRAHASTEVGLRLG